MEERNNNPKEVEYFDDTLSLFYDNIQKNEELYKEIHNLFENNSPTGFSLGAGKNTIELGKVLATIRATAIQANTALFNAKKAVTELELKKDSQNAERDSEEQQKEFVRLAMEEISNNKNRFNNKQNTVSDSEDILDNVIEKKIKNGEISLTKNEKAMKYDYNNEVDVVYDMSSESVRAVKKGTLIELEDYPIERAQIDQITKVDGNKAYTKDGRIITAVSGLEVSSDK